VRGSGRSGARSAAASLPCWAIVPPLRALLDQQRLELDALGRFWRRTGSGRVGEDGPVLREWQK
jgi:hypothetical protein